MSRVFVESLYPAATSMAKVFARDLYERVAFPARVAEKCGVAAVPTLDVSLPGFGFLSVSLRNPALLVPGLIGTILGFTGGVWCLTRSKPSVRGDFSWGFALMWFGTTNAVALPLHCWVSREVALYDELYAATVSFSTCACVSAFFGCLANCRRLDDGDQETHGTLLSFTLFVLIVTSSLTQKASEAGRDSTPQMIIELYYFSSILLLLPFLLYRTTVAARAQRSTKRGERDTASGSMREESGGGGGGGGGGADVIVGWMAVAIVSFAVMIASPLLDAPLCEALGAVAAPHTAVVAWLAGDVMVAALWMQHRAGRGAAAKAAAEEEVVETAAKAKAAAEAAKQQQQQIVEGEGEQDKKKKDEASKKDD